MAVYLTISKQKYAATNAPKQRGVALAISLILLITLTVVVLSSLSGSKLNEKVASNAQQKAISFEAAESAIGAYWVGEEVRKLLRSDSTIAYNNPGPVTPPGSTAKLSSEFDQMNAAGTKLTVDITGSVTVQFCGETSTPRNSDLSADESARRFVGTVFDINGRASLEGSNARSAHIQRGYIMSPRTERVGSCPPPTT